MMEGEDRREASGGVLRLVLGTAALAVVGPVVGMRRWWLARRRGAAVQVRIVSSKTQAAGQAERLKLEVDVDVPLNRQRAGRWMVIDALVRVAELNDRPGDRHHLFVHRRDQEEPASVPLGHRVQDLGDRLERSFSHSPLERTTHLWLTFPPDRGWPEAAPEPEDDEALERAVQTLEPRWAAATAYDVGDASILHRIHLWVPSESAERCRQFFERLDGR